MTTRGRVHDAVHRHTMAVDALLACMVLTGIMLAASSKHDDRWVSGPQTPLVITIEALVFFSLVLRRTMPIPVLFVTVLGAVSVMLLIKGWSPVGVAVVIAVYTLSRRTDRRTALITAFGCGAALVIGGACRSGDWFSTESISLLAWTGFAAALGQAIQSQKAYVAAVEERALRAEQTREEEAGRRRGGRKEAGAKEDGGMLKKGKKQSVEQDLSAARSVELVYKRNKKQTATGHEPSGKLARPNVWSRQGQ
jgi:hypothetical protein